MPFGVEMSGFMPPALGVAKSGSCKPTCSILAVNLCIVRFVRNEILTIAFHISAEKFLSHCSWT